MALLVSNVKLTDNESDSLPAVARRLGIPPRAVREVEMVKRSLDARRGKQNWTGVFRVVVDDEPRVLQSAKGIRVWTERDDGRYGRIAPEPTHRSDWPAELRPIVVGAGPAGLFTALWLAESGLPVRLLERGVAVQDRVGAVNGFWRGRKSFDPENNLIFGEGGAGTFSDGKIYTRRRDGELGFIFQRLVEFGADPEVMREAYAHLGTDRIRAILPPMRQRLLDLGCEVRFGARVEDLVVRDGVCTGVVLAGGENLEGGPVLIAAGHSARDTAAMLVRAGASAEARETAIGARIEHPQTLIDQGRYHQERKDLPPASYRLAHQPAVGRKAHTFCMCPGGMVVPASNHPERVVVNGMSFAARRARYANSAVIVEVRPEDYGAADPLAGFRWLDAIEARAFQVAGDYRAPAQRVSDLLAGRASTDLPSSSYPMGLVPCDLREVMPTFVVDGMCDAILAFEEQIPGFAGDEALLIAPETRTTSPIRFHRDETQQSTTIRGLYPVGEGAGYAGGIVSSALDGIRAARAITA